MLTVVFSMKNLVQPGVKQGWKVGDGHNQLVVGSTTIWPALGLIMGRQTGEGMR